MVGAYPDCKNLNGGNAGGCEWGHPGPLAFNASFGVGLGDQSPAFLQAQCTGVELCLLANPTDGP